jgi:ComF family protein
MDRSFPLVRFVFESCVSLLAPDVCAGCDARIGIMRVFCPACAATLMPAAATRQGEHAPFAYGGALAQAISSLKYGGRVDLARPLSHLLLRAIEPLRAGAAAPTRVVPVPLHHARLATRGYNQASLLAAPVARALGARFAPDALVRVRDAPPQATLGRSARLENMKGAFSTRRGGGSFRGEHVLLVDDVRTTGATLEACAVALKQDGAALVETVVLAVSGD